MISRHLDKNNLHHAYLIEGARDAVIPEILKFLKGVGIVTVGNPDFIQISIDNLKTDEALELRAMSSNKSYSSTKKIFAICANTLSLDAQNVLLKMFEEPIPDTHFFLVMPDVNVLVKTLVSRFYFISIKQNLIEETKQAEKFIAMPLKNRVDYIKELLTDTEDEDDEGNEIVALDSTRSRALKFLNALESALHSKFIEDFEHKTTGEPCVITQGSPVVNCLEHIFKVREFLRMPGSSTKSLMESVALIIPNFKN